MAPPFKFLKQSLNKIQHLSADASLILKTQNQLLKDYQIHLKKQEKDFVATINFVPFKGFSSTMLHSLKLEVPLELTNETDTYYLPEHSLLINSHKSNDFDSYILTGSITQITSIEDEKSIADSYIRLIIPVIHGNPNLSLIHGYVYENDINKRHDTLIKIFIEEQEYNFYEIQQNGLYLAIDSLKPLSFEKFKNIVSNISNAFGFLTGKLFLDEGYFLFSNTQSFEIINDIYYTTYRDTIITNYSLYTINPFSLYNVTATTIEGIKEESEEITKWYEKVPGFSPDIFSNLCTMFFQKEAISRGAIVLLQGNNLALEIKGSAYSVSLEAITNQILKDHSISYPKPIENAEKADELIRKLTEVLHGEFNDETEENKTIRRIFGTKIRDMNAPTNADKLSKPFGIFGYVLKAYEIEVLKGRNLYQHGKLPTKKAEDDAVFKEVYFSCLVLHRLIATLVLKYAGFKGCIINYPKLHEHITKRVLDEDLFYEI